MNITLENVNKLLEMNVGDRGRLEYIKSTLKKQNQLFSSDKEYILKLTDKYIYDKNNQDNAEVIQLKNKIMKLEAECQTKSNNPIRKVFTSPPKQRFADIGILFARLGLGFTFAWAGFGKVSDPAGFGMMLQNMMGMQPEMSTMAAYGIGSLELLTGMLLLIGFLVRPSAIFSVVILIGSLTMFGLDFGMGPAIWKDPALLGMALLLLLYGSGKFGIDARLGYKKVIPS